MKRRSLLWMLAGALFVPAVARSEQVALDWGVLRQIPKTEAELIEAHRRSEAMACEQVASGEPLEIADFKHRVAYRIAETAAPGGLPPVVEFEACRRSFVALGADMLPQDQARLPFLSSSRILDAVNSNYIALQVRVHRHGTGGAAHLFYKPYAVVGAYDDPRRAQEYSDMVRASVRDIRCLGLYVKPGATTADAAALRTMVICSRNQVVTTAIDVSPPRTRSNYELVFVRARPTPAGDDLELHTLATTEQRQKLNYLGTFKRPENVEQCAVKSTICFTDYGFGNLAPTARASRSSVVHSRASWSLDELDRFAQQRWSGTAFDHLNEVLDAIITGAAPPPSGK